MLRIKPASDTLNYLLQQLDKYGISRIADLTYLDNSTNLYVYSAVRPSAKSLTSSMGKGLTIDEAKCSALMESIETFYAEEVIPDIINVSFNQIISNGDFVLNPNKLTELVSISEDFPIDWCFGKFLNSQKDVLIPHFFLSLDSNHLMTRFVGQNSDGLASGNSFNEALMYSFWELNERISIKNDKVSLMVDRESLSPYITDAIATNFFLHQNFFDIPVVCCWIKNKNPLDNNKIFAGYTCHNNIYHAMKKALFEAIQSKIGVISGVRDDITDSFYLHTNKNKTEDRFSSTEMLSFAHISSTELSIEEEIRNIRSLLSQYKKDLAYYCYIQSEITVLKSFLVDLC